VLAPRSGRRSAVGDDRVDEVQLPHHHAHIRVAFADYPRGSGPRYWRHRGPPSLKAAESALDTYAAEIAALRREGLTQSLPGDAAEPFEAGVRGGVIELSCTAPCTASRSYS
jgi:hypothetical protein